MHRLDYNPKDPEMFSVIIDKMPILQEDEKVRKILSNYKIIKSRRQSYNLKRLLKQSLRQMIHANLENVLDQTAASAFIF